VDNGPIPGILAQSLGASDVLACQMTVLDEALVAGLPDERLLQIGNGPAQARHRAVGGGDQLPGSQGVRLPQLFLEDATLIVGPGAMHGFPMGHRVVPVALGSGLESRHELAGQMAFLDQGAVSGAQGQGRIQVADRLAEGIEAAVGLAELPLSQRDIDLVELLFHIGAAEVRVLGTSR